MQHKLKKLIQNIVTRSRFRFMSRPHAHKLPFELTFDHDSISVTMIYQVIQLSIKKINVNLWIGLKINIILKN